MKTWTGVCLHDQKIVAENGGTLILKRGHAYDLSHEKDGERCVFTNFWVWVPSKWFGDIKPRHGHRQQGGSHE